MERQVPDGSHYRINMLVCAGPGLSPPALGRGKRRPPDRTPGRCPPRHRDAAGPQGRAARQGRPRRARGLFPPTTREVQLDEKWSFVAKKQANCDPDYPADDHKGDWWDFVAYDAEHRLVLAVVPGALVDRERRGDSRRGPRSHGRTRGCAAHQRRAGGLRDGDRPRLRRPRGAQAARHARASPGGARSSGPGGVEVREGAQGPREGSGGVDRDRRGAWDVGGGVRGVGAVECEPDDQHLVRGAAPPVRIGITTRGSSGRRIGSARTGGCTGR